MSILVTGGAGFIRFPTGFDPLGKGHEPIFPGKLCQNKIEAG